MRIWLATVGEPLPINGGNVRLYRTGMLAQYLAGLGHDVLWWNSDFDHHRKVHRTGSDSTIPCSDHLEIRLLHGCGYQNHVSLARFRDQRQVAKAFLHNANDAVQPDVIIAAFPIIELAAACAQYAEARNIPLAMDVRDAWPDIFLDVAPRPLRPIARLLIGPYDAYAKRTLARAHAIFSLTDPFLQWSLDKAGRTRGACDAVIPMTYEMDTPDQVDNNALESWRAEGLDPAQQYIICLFCTFGRQFDIQTICDAAARLESLAIFDVRFVLCGQGEGLEELKRRSLHITSVIFPGWTDRLRITALMSMSSAGLTPYWPDRNFSGNLPNKPIEYLSSGLPILNSLTGHLADLIHEHDIGESYTAGDAISLVEAVLRLRSCNDPTARRQRCAKLFVDRYRSESVLELHHQSILNLVEHFNLQHSSTGQ